MGGVVITGINRYAFPRPNFIIETNSVDTRDITKAACRKSAKWNFVPRVLCRWNRLAYARYRCHSDWFAVHSDTWTYIYD